MPGQALGNANARAEQAEDQRMTLPDHFNFATDAQSHRHQSMKRGICGIDMMDKTVRAGGQLVETLAGIYHGVHLVEVRSANT